MTEATGTTNHSYLHKKKKKLLEKKSLFEIRGEDFPNEMNLSV